MKNLACCATLNVALVTRGSGLSAGLDAMDLGAMMARSAQSHLHTVEALGALPGAGTTKKKTARCATPNAALDTRASDLSVGLGAMDLDAMTVRFAQNPDPMDVGWGDLRVRDARDARDVDGEVAQAAPDARVVQRVIVATTNP